MNLEMHKINIGQIVNIQAYKHDGTLYRQWNGAKIIEVSPEAVVVFLYKSKVKEKNGQKWVVREPIIWWFPTHQFFNTTGLIRQSGTHFYTNLSSPAVFEDETIKFIDYDLDIKSYPGQPIKVVDRNEYAVNSQKYEYPKKLKDILESTTSSVVKLIEYKEAYFDEEVVQTYLDELIRTKMLSQKFGK